jgi:hypothetical protein
LDISVVHITVLVLISDVIRKEVLGLYHPEEGNINRADSSGHRTMFKKRHSQPKKPRLVLIPATVLEHKIAIILPDKDRHKKADHLHQLHNPAINLKIHQLNQMYIEPIPQILHIIKPLTTVILLKDDEIFQV